MTRFLVRLAVTAGLAICGWLLGLAFSATALAAEPGLDESDLDKSSLDKASSDKDDTSQTDRTMVGATLDGLVGSTRDVTSSTVETVTSTTQELTSSGLNTVTETTAKVTDGTGLEPVQDTVETVTGTVDKTVGAVKTTLDGTVDVLTETVDVVTQPVRDAVDDTVTSVTPKPAPVETAPEPVAEERAPAPAPVDKAEKPASRPAVKPSRAAAPEQGRTQEATRTTSRLDLTPVFDADAAMASIQERDEQPFAPDLPATPGTGTAAATALAGDSAAKKLGTVVADTTTTHLQRAGLGSTLPAAATVAAAALPCTSPD